MSSLRKPSLTIFFPCYNDAGTIGSLVVVADEVAREYTEDYEILVVDDGSTDGSRELLQQLQAKFSRLRLILHEGNHGYGAALQSGFRHAAKDMIFYTDGDAQYDVFELRKLLPVMQPGVDVVNGYKLSRSDPLHRILLGRIYLFVTRLLFNFQVRDLDCDFRLLRRRVLDTVRLHHTSGVICLELVKKLEMAGYRFVDFPVHHYHRVHGKSQYFTIWRLLRTSANILRLWWELMVRRQTPIGIAYPQDHVQARRPPSCSLPGSMLRSHDRGLLSRGEERD